MPEQQTLLPNSPARFAGNHSLWADVSDSTSLPSARHEAGLRPEGTVRTDEKRRSDLPPSAEKPAADAATIMERVEQMIGQELVEVERILFEELASENAYIRDLLQHVSRFRGKRLRPILVLLSAKACGGITPAHRTIAAVVEMIHLATLIHDDVLDDATTRRHVATVNSRWNNETSVLFGDYLFTHAFHLASSLETTYACRTIGRATNLVCEGELTQVQNRGNVDLSEETYFRIIDGKTAELCAVSTELGAYYAGQSPANVAAIEQFGRLLGHAFQIADDVLDLLGSEAKTGKSLGSDLQKQKLTLPLIRLLATASPEDGQQIRALLAQPAVDTRQRLEPFFQQSDALEFTQARAFKLVADAISQLNCVADSPARQLLADMAQFAALRSA